MRYLLPVIGLLCAFCNVASVQIDTEVRNQAAGLVVTGKASHPLDSELPRLDAIRRRILDSISNKLRDPKPDLDAEYKALAKFEQYCFRMSELVAAQHPNAVQAKSWLEANAAVAGVVLSANGGTVSFAGTSRLAELERIRTRLGREFSGDLGGHIASVRKDASSPLPSSVAVAGGPAAGAGTPTSSSATAPSSSGAALPVGISELTLRVNSQQSNERVVTAIGFNIGSGGPKNPVGVTFNMRYTGPRSATLNSMKKQFKPGESIGTSEYYTINTTGLPDGTYTAILEVVDDYGNAAHSTDLFTVNRKNARTFTGSVTIGGTRYDIELEVGMGGSPSLVGGNINGQPISKVISLLGVVNFDAGSISGSIAGLPGEGDNQANVNLRIGSDNGRAVVTVK